MPSGEFEKINYSPRYPFYKEQQKITFFPTYKRNQTDNYYKNKKSQAPSYCDRILFKNNTSQACKLNYYKCLDLVYGSDHRPVVLSISINQKLIQQNQAPFEFENIFKKNIAPNHYVDTDKEFALNAYKLLNFNLVNKYVSLNLSQIRQKYGVLSFKFITIVDNFELPKDVLGNIQAHIKK